MSAKKEMSPKKKKTASGLAIALPKGRIFREAVQRLLKAGLLSGPISDESRILIQEDAGTGLRVLILRNYD
ncbi:MAG: hypothetical protein HY618_08825, partial [Candidatus Tectomicrobia bacterium]|nr:hypothetical protein [Candidatus Tectomicrobia bacterium]